jgi:hypothetical protein
MNHYALFFRSSRTYTSEEIKQNAAAIQVWVKRVQGMGIKLDPRNLDGPATRFSADGSTVISHEGPSDPTLGTIVFFDSASPDQALEIARIHPAAHYGVTVELREWNPPHLK